MNSDGEMTIETMAKDDESDLQDSYPLRVVTRLTGLKPELLRAWESRHDAVRPSRTQGGARRYSSVDLERLRLLRDVVGAGHRIGSIARLADGELTRILANSKVADVDRTTRLLDAADQLDAATVHRAIMEELANREAAEFAREFAIPLLVEIGDRWAAGRSSVSAEHLISGILRSLLMNLALASPTGEERPRIVFATPEGEPHDLGTLISALVAARSGATPTFLGAEVPVADLAKQVIDSGATVVVLGLVVLEPERGEALLRDLRNRLPRKTALWIGGAGIRGLAPIRGVERIDGLNQLEARVAQMDLQGALPAIEGLRGRSIESSD
jgi:DNA-binding transcriptional MerR regulator